MKDKIKPCPFCGSDAEFYSCIPKRSRGYIRCLTRGCRGRSPHGTRLFDDALLRWNIRSITINKTEFLGRYVDRLVSQSQGNLAYLKDAEFLCRCADAGYELWSDPKEGLQDETPEDMADTEISYWYSER